MISLLSDVCSRCLRELFLLQRASDHLEETFPRRVAVICASCWRTCAGVCIVRVSKEEREKKKIFLKKQRVIWQFQCQQELIPAVQRNHWKQRKSKRFHWNWARAWQLANANVSRQLGVLGGGGWCHSASLREVPFTSEKSQEKICPSLLSLPPLTQVSTCSLLGCQVDFCACRVI